MVVRAGGVGAEAGRPRGGSEETERGFVSFFFFFFLLLVACFGEKLVSCGFLVARHGIMPYP